MRVEIERRAVRLRAPLRTAHGELAERELLLLTLRGRDGTVGRGEAAPLEPYDGVSLADARAALERCREVLEPGDGHPAAELLAGCRERAVLPQALSAVDLALWDLAGRRAGLPVWRLLGAREPEPVEVNALVDAADRAGAADQAARALRAGHRCLKVKVGTGDDAGRLAAVRAAAGPAVALRVDANGAWGTPAHALAHLAALAPAGLELCEEPVHGIAALRAVREATPVPVAMDETAAAPGALSSGAADLVVLKVARCGGIGGTLDAARRVRAAGGEVLLASSLDGPLGIAAALHAAAALGPLRACGLATLELFEDPAGALAVLGGRIAVPGGPGLGV